MKLALALLLALHCVTQSPDYAYGKPEDLKGLHKVFINTGDDLKSREQIEKSLKESKLGFELLNSEEGAEIVLIYGAWTEHGTVGISQPNGQGMIARADYPTGKGSVLVAANPKPKLVMSFSFTQETAFQHKPVTNFVNNFLKAYKKANGVK